MSRIGLRRKMRLLSGNCQVTRRLSRGVRASHLHFPSQDLLCVLANSAEMILGMISAELAPARAAKPQANWAVHGGRTATTRDPSGSRLVICLAWFWVTPATGSVIG